jgi:hypothetical protein
MNEKYNLIFAINNLKKAIFKLECANKLVNDIVDQNIINELKATLIIQKNRLEEIKNNE